MKKTDFSPTSTPSPSLPLLRFSTSAFAISQRVSLYERKITKIQKDKKNPYKNFFPAQRNFISIRFINKQISFVGEDSELVKLWRISYLLCTRWKKKMINRNFIARM